MSLLVGRAPSRRALRVVCEPKWLVSPIRGSTRKVNLKSYDSVLLKSLMMLAVLSHSDRLRLEALSPSVLVKRCP